MASLAFWQRMPRHRQHGVLVMVLIGLVAVAARRVRDL